MSRLSQRARWIVALVALVGCASRAIPDRLPSSSAASLDGAEAVASPVAVALHADPPLPGETPADWEGLTPAADAGAAPIDPHAGHHHAP